jgi:branched-chain amino acid transport system permease protein
VLIMLLLGGIGRLYGAFIGAPLYMLAQDALAKEDPAYWYFWIGALLVIAVFFARGGVLGLADRLLARMQR